MILINWNSADYAAAAVASLRNSSYQNIRVIIVDNASTDDSLSRLNDLEGVDLISNPINSGFAGGCNIGINYALSVGCEYIYLLNVDAVITSRAIDTLVDVSRQLKDKSALGSVLRLYSNGQYEFFGSYTNNKSGTPAFYRYDKHSELLKLKTIETCFIMGAALFIPSYLLYSAGLFDERFFLYYEETDWCYRIRRLGFECRMVPSSVVFHHSGGTVGGLRAPLFLYFYTRNELLFLEKNANCYQLFKSFVRKGRRAAAFVWDKAFNHRQLAAKSMYLGVRDYVLRRFGDCPQEIREYAAEYRSVEARAAQP